MGRSVSFELGISLGEVKRRPEPKAWDLDDPFTWGVTCDDGAVTIHARIDGRTQVLAHGVWMGGALVRRAGKSPEFPNAHQWEMVERALATVRAPAADHEPPAAAPPPAADHEPHVVDPAPPVAPRPPLPPIPSAPPIPRVAAGDPGSRATPPSPAPRSRVPWAVATVAVVLLTLAGILAVTLRGTSSSRPARTEHARPSPEPPPSPPSLEEQVTRAASLAEATELARPHLGDGLRSRGAWLLARYAAANLVWSEELATPETTMGLVLKDSERERGKRLCVTGTLRDIERQDVDQRPVYVGELETADGDGAHFIAVGSTGTLVKRSPGTLCGVVTGKHAKAAVIVGLFDLPENRAPAVER